MVHVKTKILKRNEGQVSLGDDSSSVSLISVHSVTKARLAFILDSSKGCLYRKQL